MLKVFAMMNKWSRHYFVAQIFIFLYLSLEKGVLIALRYDHLLNAPTMVILSHVQEHLLSGVKHAVWDLSLLLTKGKLWVTMTFQHNIELLAGESRQTRGFYCNSSVSWTGVDTHRIEKSFFKNSLDYTSCTSYPFRPMTCPQQVPA